MIRLENVRKTFQGQVAVSEFNLEVAEGEMLVLLGKSGSGKTTTLKMINRLIEPDDGAIYINGEPALGQSPEKLRRKIGYVIQHTGLFPHYTVRENIALVPQLLGWSGDKISNRIASLLAMVGLPESLADRYPDALSGGQKQRVGIARALAADPPVVLLDEPFGALDPLTRRQVQEEFRKLRQKDPRTMVMVTHDMTEAVLLADRICLMENGMIEQVGTPFDLVFNPTSTFVRSFFEDFRFRLELMVLPPAELISFFPEEDTYSRQDATDTAKTSFELLSILENNEQSETGSRVTIEGRQFTLTTADVVKAYYDWRTAYNRKAHV